MGCSESLELEGQTSQELDRKERAEGEVGKSSDQSWSSSEGSFEQIEIPARKIHHIETP
jgi:hypothetical protein